MARFCMKCGTALTEGMKFCMKCGTPVPKTENAVCKKCGADLKPGMKFCMRCGQAVTENRVVIPVQEPVLSMEMSDTPPEAVQQIRSCPECGAALKENVRFCTKCGAKTAAAVAKKVVETLLKSCETQASSAPGEVGFSLHEGGNPVEDRLMQQAIKALRGGR